MKYDLFLYFRLAICTLIVPSTLFASNEAKDKTLDQCMDEVCNILEKKYPESITKDNLKEDFPIFAKVI